KRRRRDRIPYGHVALVPGGDEPGSVGGQIEGGQLFTMRARDAAYRDGSRDIDDEHLARTHDGQALTQAVEAQSQTVTDGEARHLGPGARARARAPEPQGPFAVKAERREQIAGGGEREISDGLPRCAHKNLTTEVGRRTNLAYRALVIVHLVDGTYELFRYFMSPAAAFERTAPEELRAVRGVVTSMLGMLEGGATHLGVATDHVIESFRNGLWPGYKTGEGIDPLLYDQFEPLEEALRALGVVVWAMVEFE